MAILINLSNKYPCEWYLLWKEGILLIEGYKFPWSIFAEFFAKGGRPT